MVSNEFGTDRSYDSRSQPQTNGHHETKFTQDPIAVVGMACRLPGDCNSPHELWQFLEQGGIAGNQAPESRFNMKNHYDGSRKPKTMRSPGGMFLNKVDPQDFDAGFFSVSKTDAIAMDPQQRQLLEVVYECLENAGISLDAINDAPVGCFVGSYAVGMYFRTPKKDPSVAKAIKSRLRGHAISRSR